MDKRLKIFCLSILLLAHGCASEFSIQPYRTNSFDPCTSSQGRNIAIFFDGTGNNPASYTNVANLYNLVRLQPRTDIHPLYLVGVGNVGYIQKLGDWLLARESYVLLFEICRQ